MREPTPLTRLHEQNCVWRDVGDGTCQSCCGYVARSNDPTTCFAECRQKTPSISQAPVVRLGDRIESALESFGVTKERYAAAKQAIGLPATCNCAARRDWLNRLDAELGLGEKLAAFRGLLGW